MAGNTTSTTTFRADISDLRRGMQEATRQIKLANSEFRAASAGLDDWTRSATGLSAKLRSLDTVLGAQRRQLSLLEDELQDTIQEYGENSAAADRLRVRINNQTAAIGRTEREIRTYQSQLDSLEDETDDMTEETDDMNASLDRTKASSKKASDGFTTMKGVLSDLLASGIKAAISGLKKLADTTADAYKAFDDGRDSVIKATGATGEFAKELTESYQNVATSIKGDLSSIGGAIGEVNTRFGYTGEKLEKTTEDFLKFADITGTDAVQSVQLVSRAMGDAGVPAEEYKKVLDELAVATQGSGISIDTLAENLTKYGAPMRALGFDTEESIAIFSQWEKAGVNTEVAFSGMKNAISSWGKEGKDAKEEFKKTLDEIGKAPSTAEATAKAIEVFGKKAGPDLADAIKGGRFAFDDFLKLVKNSSGTVDNTYEETQSGLDKLQLGVQAAKVELGSFFGEFIERYEPEVNRFIDGFVSNVKKIMTSISELASNASLGKAVEIYKTATGSIISAAEEFAPKLIAIAKTAMDSLPAITSAVFDVANNIIKKIPDILKSLVGAAGQLIDSIRNAVVSESSVLAKSFIELFNSFKTAVPSILSMLAENLPSVIDSVIDFVVDSAPALLDASIKMWSAFADALPEVVPDILKGVVDVLIKITSSIAARLPDITNAAVRMLGGITYGIAKIVPKIIEAVPKIYLAVTENLIAAMPQVLDAAKNMLFGIIYAITEIIPNVVQNVQNVIDAIRNAFSNAYNFLVDAGRDIVRGLWMGINDMVGWIKGKIQEFARGIVDTMKKAVKIGSPSKVMRDEVGYWMAMGIPAGFDKAYSSVAKRLSLTAKSLTGGFVASLVKGLYSTSGGLSKVSVNAAKLAEQAMQTAVSSSDFSGAASTAATRFSDALEKKIDYFSKKIQYQNEQRISAFDDNIAELERRQDQETADEEAANSKRVERLKKERDAYVAKAEKRLKKEKDEKEKANINKEISIIKKRYEKLINAQENASKKQIAATKKEYETLIKEQEKARASYEKASSEALEEFNDAMAEYKENARSFIESSVNGLADSFQQQYDSLISKQDKLIDKLKTAGELFNVSNARVITLNDIRQQTANIKEYAERLNQIKEKVSNELFQEITDYDMKEGNAFMKQLLSMSEDELAAYNEAYGEKMRLAEQVAEDLYQPDFENLSKDYEKSVEDMFTGLPDKLNELAKEAMAGFTSGLLENTDYMETSVRKIISALVDEFKEGLDIHSPSKVLEKLGAFAGEGFADGLESVIGLVKESAGELMNAASSPLIGIKDGFQEALSGIAASGMPGNGRGMSVVNNYNLVQNNTSPKSLSALETYQARRQQLAMLKTLTV